MLHIHTDPTIIISSQPLDGQPWDWMNHEACRTKQLNQVKHKCNLFRRQGSGWVSRKDTQKDSLLLGRFG